MWGTGKKLLIKFGGYDVRLVSRFGLRDAQLMSLSTRLLSDKRIFRQRIGSISEAQKRERFFLDLVFRGLNRNAQPAFCFFAFPKRLRKIPGVGKGGSRKITSCHPIFSIFSQFYFSIFQFFCWSGKGMMTHRLDLGEESKRH